MLKIKICGITNVADALLASEEGVDFIGLIFAPRSRRIDVDTAKEIVSEMPEGVVPVGVFQDQPAEEVRNILTTCGIRFALISGRVEPWDHFVVDKIVMVSVGCTVS